MLLVQPSSVARHQICMYVKMNIATQLGLPRFCVAQSPTVARLGVANRYLLDKLDKARMNSPKNGAEICANTNNFVLWS